MNILYLSMFSLAAAAAVVLLFQRARKMRQMMGLLEFAQNQIDELQDAIIAAKNLSDASNRRDSDQARRIAWLESKVRRPRPASDEVLDDAVVTQPSRLSMTERRHRVISLASRGNNADTIASSLGLFKGEVELILNLNKATLGQR